MKAPSKPTLGCLLLLAAAAYLFFFQLPYLADPGLRDLHIRRKIKTLNEHECAEIIQACERIYREHIHLLVDRSTIIKHGLPAAALRVGYKEAILSTDMVKFRAGGGGFSQVGPIMIISFMDPKSGKAKYLTLDGGRIFDPARKVFLSTEQKHQFFDSQQATSP